MIRVELNIKSVENQSSLSNYYKVWAKMALNNYDSTLEDFNLSLLNDPFDLTSYKFRANAKEKLGDKIGADLDYSLYKEILY